MAELAFGIETSKWSPVETGLITLFFVGVEAFWFWVLIIRRDPESTPRDGTPDAAALRSPSALRQAMAIHGGNQDALRRAEHTGKVAVAEFLFWQFLIVAAVLGPFWIFTGGRFDRGIDSGQARIWVAIVLAPTVLLIFRIATGLVGKGLDAGAVQLGTLGLTALETPTVDLAASPGGPRTRAHGESVLRGTRHGRDVEVCDGGASSTVTIRASTPAFLISSDDGKLSPSADAPAEVKDALRKLRRAKRWSGVRLTAGHDQLTVERQQRYANGWLYDLWLAETLLAAVGKNGASEDLGES